MDGPPGRSEASGSVPASASRPHHSTLYSMTNKYLSEWSRALGRRKTIFRPFSKRHGSVVPCFSARMRVMKSFWEHKFKKQRSRWKSDRCGLFPLKTITMGMSAAVLYQSSDSF